MAKSRRKSNGCKRGTYKPKKMGKGALTDSKMRGKRPEHTTPEALKAAAEKRDRLIAEAAAKS